MPNIIKPLGGLTTSAQLAAALSDETGTGLAVFSTSPVFTTQISTPKIVTASGNLEILPPGNADIVLQGSGTGNVGIGTTSPINSLTVGSGIDAAASGATLGVKGYIAVQHDSGIKLRDTGWTRTLSLGQSSSVGTILGDGGLNISGDTSANGVLMLQGTISGTRTTSYVNIQPNGGNVGIGVTVPTAVLHLKAGTATANTAPLKFTAGTNLTTPEIGAMEFVDNGTTGHLYITLNVAGVLTRVQIA